MRFEDITKEVVSVPNSASFRDTLDTMIEKQTNSLVVVDEEGVFIGQVSVSDLLNAIVPKYLNGDTIAALFATEEMFKEAIKDAKDMPVTDFMKTDIQPVNEEDSLMSVATQAIDHKRASVPVVDKNGHPTAIISRRGLKHILADFLHDRSSA